MIDLLRSITRLAVHTVSYRRRGLGCLLEKIIKNLLSNEENNDFCREMDVLVERWTDVKEEKLTPKKKVVYEDIQETTLWLIKDILKYFKRTENGV